MLRIDYRHSASRGNAFIDSPAYWIITELFGYEDKANDRMIMGNAAEEAAYEGLNGLHLDQVISDAETAFDRVSDNKEAPERAWAGLIAKRFVDSLKEFGKVKVYQREIITEKFYGLTYPIKCLLDFEFKDIIVDTKATAYLKRLKSGSLDSNWYPKDSDVRQQLLYQKVFGKPTMLLYASAKDQECVDMVDRDPMYLQQLVGAFRTIEHITKIAKTKDDIVKMYPLTFDNFRWGKGMTESKKFAKDVWQTIWKI